MLEEGTGPEQETGLGPHPRGVWRKVWGGEGLGDAGGQRAITGVQRGLGQHKAVGRRGGGW